MRQYFLVMLILRLVVFGVAPTFSPPALAVEVKAESPDFVRSSLAKGNYPWYDAARDRVQPLNLSRAEDWSWLRSIRQWIDWAFQKIGSLFGRVGDRLNLPGFSTPRGLLPFALIAIGAMLLVALIWKLWNSGGFSTTGDRSSQQTIGGAGRITTLPDEFGSASAKDPWAEAVARKRRGDYSGAVIYLFAHQLLELDGLGLVRLTPGGTGRKYVRSVLDPDLRGPLSATLDLFEQAYYGHKKVSASSFERVWEAAQSFQSQLAMRRKNSS